MKNVYLFCCIMLLAGASLAQQRPHYSQYMLNNYILNPALSGIEDYTDVKLGYRQQWVGLEGAPLTYYATVHTPLNKTDISKATLRNKNIRIKQIGLGQKPRPHHGIGLIAQSDKTGPLKSTLLNASYAFHLPISQKSKISAGISGGLLQYNLNPNEVSLAYQNDHTLYNTSINRLKLDLNIGLWLYSQRYFVGLAASQLLRDTKDAEGFTNFNGSGNLQKHFIATAGYKFDLSPTLALVPSIQANIAVPSPPSLDFNLKASYIDRVWLGGSYRHGDALAGLAGINISSLLSLGYSYDITTSTLSYGNSGSHEVVLGLKLQNKGKVICPIWMW